MESTDFNNFSVWDLSMLRTFHMVLTGLHCQEFGVPLFCILKVIALLFPILQFYALFSIPTSFPSLSSLGTLWSSVLGRYILCRIEVSSSRSCRSGQNWQIHIRWWSRFSTYWIFLRSFLPMMDKISCRFLGVVSFFPSSSPDTSVPCFFETHSDTSVAWSLSFPPTTVFFVCSTVFLSLWQRFQRVMLALSTPMVENLTNLVGSILQK